MTNRWVNPINNNILRDLQDNVLASGSVAFYEAGTSTPLAVYSDPELTVSLGSYIDADAYGLLPDFHMASGTQYKAVAYDAIGGAGGAGAVKWTRDDVFGADSSVDTRLDALESTVSEISASSNALVNGGMRVTSGAATTLTTSYLEGAVFGTYGKVANVTAGTLTQAQDDDYASGYVSIFSGVSTDNAAATVDTQFRIQSKDSFQFMNGNGVFSAYVEHDVGSSVNYTITVSVANAADDFSSVTNVLVGSATAVATGTRTQISLPVEGLGDCSNGIAITISAACGIVTTKNFKIGEAQFERGLAATGFTELPYDVVEAAETAIRPEGLAAFASRDSAQPWLNGVGAIERLTGSGNWTVPAGVYRVKVTMVGGGGGGVANGGNGGDGGDTTFGSLTCRGGAGGVNGTESTESYKLGSVTGAFAYSIVGSNGVLSAPSGTNKRGEGGSNPLGQGGKFGPGTTASRDPEGYGSGGGAANPSATACCGGQSGAYGTAYVDVTPGDLIAYSVGTGGAPGSGGLPTGYDAGKAGTIILEY